MKILNLTLIAIMAIVFYACSDNATNNPLPSKNYYPLTIGSAWQYEVAQIDTLGADVGSASNISYTVSRYADTLGKTKVSLVTSTPGGYVAPTIMEGSALSIYEAPIDFLLSEVIIPNRWNKYVDFSAQAQWSIFDTTLTGLQTTIDAGGGMTIPVTMDGTVNETAKNVGTETIIVKNKTYTDCAKITRTIVTTLKVKGSVMGIPLEIPVTSTVTSNYWFADGIGLVKAYATPLVPVADLSAVPALLTDQIKAALANLYRPGFRKELISSTIIP